MKKSTTFLALAFALLCSTLSVNAQTNPNHIFHINTSYMVAGLDSTDRSVRDAMLKEYLTKVTQKNEFIIRSWSMTHLFSEDSREFVTVSEFANWGDIEKANNRDGELEKQAWPNTNRRNDFMKKLSSYFTHHKDAVYGGIPILTK